MLNQRPDPSSLIPTHQSPPIVPRKSHLLLKISLLTIFLLSLTGAFYLGKISSTIKPIPTSISPTNYATQFQLSLTRDETANWKTYVDTKYGYSLKYPPQLRLETFTTPIGNELARQSFIPINGNYNTDGAMEIAVSNDLNIDTLKGNGRIVSKTPTKMLDLPSQFIEVDEVGIGGGGYDFLEVFQKEDIIYVLSFYSRIENHNIHRLLFKQILSTFRFID